MQDKPFVSEQSDQIAHYRTQIDQFILTLANKTVPTTLYEPIRYILHSSGKRIRPLLTLISGKMAGGDVENLLPIAAALEVFHNFTLVHDDIMDHANERRGVPTVHKKWDENVAILSGDMMVGMSYRLITESGSSFLKDILTIFSDGVDAVCEGQALDKEFEVRDHVVVADYLEMIEKKTGWLIASALEMGYASVCGRDKKSEQFKQLGLLLGRGFQLQDDYLDLFGDARLFGKKTGGDIVEGKKTYLLLLASELATGEDKKLVNQIINHEVTFSDIETVKEAFVRLGVKQKTENKISQTFHDTSILLGSFEKMPNFELLKLQIEHILNRKF